MDSERRISLRIVVDAQDPSKCSAKCPNRDGDWHDRHEVSNRLKQQPAGLWCSAFHDVARGELPTPPRLTACIAAEVPA